MLSRRHLRIKVLHALYEYFQNPGADMARGAKRLNESIENIYELYLYELRVLTDIQRIAEDEIERRKSKKLPSAEDLNPPTRFTENCFLNWLRSNIDFQKKVEENTISWREERDLLRRIFKKFVKTPEFEKYLSAPSSLEEDKKIVKFLYGTFIVSNDSLHQIYEDSDLHWSDDLDAAQMMVAKTIKGFSSQSDEHSNLPRLIKDADDLEFARTLYQKCITRSDEYERLIHDKAQHWELDRIALIDIILMKLAIAELIHFQEIPVKVTLNEYIELSKEYSTPKSGNFINGVLDKVKAELIEKGDIRKIGRGLL